MSNRSKEIACLTTTTEGKFLEVSLIYLARKGYVVNVQPITKGLDTHPNGSGQFLTSYTFVCFTNKSKLVETAPRFNAKTLDKLALAETTKAVYAPLVAEICTRDGLVLA